MEGGNSMPGGMLPGSTGSGMLGLDMPLHPQPHSSRHPQQQQQLFHHHHVLPFPTAQPHDADHRPQQQQISHAYPTYGGSRGEQHPVLIPEDEPGFGEEGVGPAAADGANRVSPSPWQRVKWTDNMVRLLILVVYYMGDDGATEGDQHPQPAAAAMKGKKASAPSASAGTLQQQQQQQKKGKWKSVSRAMMEKGFSVSPQQCEDKFNDLNKRYKRVNDLLGKGTACRVVENPALLDSMGHLSPKAMEEARKLLNSKHLFFPEMCAYHNGCAAAAATSSCAPPLPRPLQQAYTEQSKQLACFHHTSDTAAGSRGDAASVVKGGGGLGRVEREGITEEDQDGADEDVDSEEVEEDDCDDAEEDDEDDEDDDHNTIKKHHPSHSHNHQHQHQKYEEGDEDVDSKGLVATATTTSACSGAKRPRRTTLAQPTPSASHPLSLSLWSPPATSIQQLKCELMGLAGRGERQQRQWLKRKAAELEEQQVGYQCQALQLESQRFKWLRFSSNKEREMGRMKLDNERLRLDNERMLLLLRQKELELINNASGGNGSSLPVQFTADRFQQQPPMRILQPNPTKDHPKAGAAGPFDI